MPRREVPKNKVRIYHRLGERCARCKEGKYTKPARSRQGDPPGVGQCSNCGVSNTRQVRTIRRNRPIGGKRGRNSGTTKTAKNKNK